MISKYRHEIKFLCTEEQLRLIEFQIMGLLKRDPFAGEEGSYLIRSLYFDDIYGTCYQENRDGLENKSKFRIRAYNCSKDRISLEKKEKNGSMTRKKSCLISYAMYQKMLHGESMMDYMGRDAILDEWVILSADRLLRPRVLAEYVRTPYVYDLGSVRVTMDRNIMAASPWYDMFIEDVPRVSVLKTGRHILEIKFDDFLPDSVMEIVTTHHLQQTAFSKFYLGCRALRGEL